jgi:hypothetical protein
MHFRTESGANKTFQLLSFSRCLELRINFRNQPGAESLADFFANSVLLGARSNQFHGAIFHSADCWS